MERPASHTTVARSPLADCFALVRRADAHLKALDALLDRVIKGDPYWIDARIDAEPIEEAIAKLPSGKGRWRAVAAGPAEAREIVLIGRVRRVPPSQRAGLLIADAVNNLRAALDHAVWQLSLRSATPPDPIPHKGPGNEWRYVGWPIVTAPMTWARTAAMRLRFIDHGVWAQFEGLQPFHRRQQQPEADEFAVLDELWKIYKHRHLPLTQLWVGLAKAVSLLNRVTIIDFPPGYADELRKRLREHDFEIISDGAPRPFEDGTELGRIREAAPPYSWMPEVYVDAHLTVHVAFHEGPVDKGSSVQDALRLIRDEVFAALKAVEPLF